MQKRGQMDQGSPMWRTVLEKSKIRVLQIKGWTSRRRMRSWFTLVLLLTSLRRHMPYMTGMLHHKRLLAKAEWVFRRTWA